jgi:hypothetical protein
MIVDTALAWLIHRHVKPTGKRLIVGFGDDLRARFGMLATQRG